jgi:cell wall assembly regulator SMI1
MTPSVTDSWARIETWLTRHAPRAFAALEPPADPAAIAAAEETVGQPFPASLRESLSRHNGSGYQALLPPFWMLLDVRSIVDSRQRRMRIYGDEPGDREEGDPESEYGPWWHPEWIPFAADGAGDHLVVDQRRHGRRGRIGDADHETGCSFSRSPVWASLPALLAATATALETGEPMEGYCRTAVDGTELEWEDA